MKHYDTVEKGQLRRWKFVHKEPGFVPSPRQGKCFLIADVEGIRCDTVQDGGTSESFYVQWLVLNSEPVGS